jgi:hypothetical protein
MGFFCFIPYIYYKKYIMSKIKQIVKEDMSKTEVNKEIKNFISSDDFKQKVEKIVKDRIKNEKELEDKVVEITKNVITQLFKTLWTKRNFWNNNLTNKTN